MRSHERPIHNCERLFQRDPYLNWGFDIHRIQRIAMHTKCKHKNRRKSQHYSGGDISEQSVR